MKYLLHPQLQQMKARLLAVTIAAKKLKKKQRIETTADNLTQIKDISPKEEDVLAFGVERAWRNK